MSNQTYNTLKWIAQILLPAMAAMYFGLANIWKFPFGEQVVGTITVLTTFLGLFLGLNSTIFNSSACKEEETPKSESPIGFKWSSIPPIKMTSGTYDLLVFVAQFGLPGLGSLIFSLSGIWGFQNGDLIVGTIAVAATFLGAILGISNAQYKEANRFKNIFSKK